MAPTHGKWIQIDQKDNNSPGGRSSHAISLVGQKVYIFGGEFTPRVPVENKLYIFDLEKHVWSIADVSGEVPPPLIGVTMVAVGKIIYLFGGEDVDQTVLNELYSFDTLTNNWKLLSDGDSAPPHRKYHASTADERHVYIFGGWDYPGRRNDLWCYDTVDQKWIQYPPARENLKGVGGPGLVLAQDKIWVMYGFTGMEVDDVYYFDLVHKTWAHVDTKGEKPTARSVFSMFGVGKYIFMYGGEVVPSQTGPAAAGEFTDEVYALDIDSFVWNRVEDGLGSDNHPGPRAWSACVMGRKGGELGLLVYGGVSPNNDRLDDIFFFTPSLVETSQ